MPPAEKFISNTYAFVSFIGAINKTIYCDQLGYYGSAMAVCAMCCIGLVIYIIFQDKIETRLGVSLSNSSFSMVLLLIVLVVCFLAVRTG